MIKQRLVGLSLWPKVTASKEGMASFPSGGSALFTGAPQPKEGDGIEVCMGCRDCSRRMAICPVQRMQEQSGSASVQAGTSTAPTSLAPHSQMLALLRTFTLRSRGVTLKMTRGRAALVPDGLQADCAVCQDKEISGGADFRSHPSVISQKLRGPLHSAQHLGKSELAAGATW